MDNKDSAPQDDAPKTQIPVSDDNDMTVDEKGTMQDQDMSSEASNQVTTPEPMMDVAPPPQDEVVSVPEPTPEPEIQEAPAAVEENPSQQVVTPEGAAPVAAASTELPKKSGKGLIIAIAVVLALVLAAIAVLVYMKTNTSTKSSNKSATNDTTTTVQAAKVTVTEVDTASKEVDETLNSLNDTQDFASDVISDKALGLQ